MRLFLILFLLCSSYFAKGLPLQNIQLPEGFHISVYAEGLSRPRQMSWGKNGTLYVGSFEDKAYALQDSDHDHKADKVFTVAKNLWMPVGVAYHQGDLYISSTGKIVKLPNIEGNLENPPSPVVINDKDYPDIRHHGWKFIKFGPDGKLYVPIGAPCNICLKDDPRFASITRINPDGSGFEIIGQGIRNSVGFDWHPESKQLWFTNNGRDWLGNDLPPEELNKLSFEGEHFGFPFEHANGIKDPEFYGKKPSSFKTTLPAATMTAHTAPLGMRFYTGKQFPEKYHNAIFIAQHGSWNRDTPAGYQVMVAFLDQNNNVKEIRPFATGWLQKNGKNWGRPADIEIGEDGSLLIADDYAGVIYRIFYTR